MTSGMVLARRRAETSEQKNRRLSTFDQKMANWFPSAALFIFVAYRGLRDVISSVIGMYSLVVYVLTGIAWLLLVAYWMRGGLRLNKRFFLLPVTVFAAFAFYIVFRGIDGFVFDEYALPQAVNPMGGMVAFFFLASQNDACRADTALKLATIVMTLFLQSSLGSVMQATSVAGYDMALGFDALFFALLSLHFITDDKGARSLLMTLVWIVCVVLNVALILSYGSRGPLLGLIAFAALRLLVYIFGSTSSVLRKFLASALAIGAAIILALSLNNMAVLLNSQLNSMGINSRTLEKFLYSNVVSDSGRSVIWGALTPRITLLGNGPFSDQAYLGAGNYCHNFVLEVFYDFGVLLGLVVLVILLYYLIKAFRSYGVSPWFPLFLTLLSFCIGRLSLSGTFWTETYFWALLAVMGLCVSDLKKATALSEAAEKGED